MIEHTKDPRSCIFLVTAKDQRTGSNIRRFLEIGRGGGDLAYFSRNF
jgi:hypothetical protein